VTNDSTRKKCWLFANNLESTAEFGTIGGGARSTTSAALDSISSYCISFAWLVVAAVVT